MPNLHRHTLYERMERRRKVAKMYLEGETQERIATQLGCSIGTVGADLKVIRQTWINNSVRDFDERKSEELAKLDRLEKEAWEALHKSKKEEETLDVTEEFVRVNVRGSKKGAHRLIPVKKVVKQKTKGPKAGDPRYMEVIERCIEMRLKIMGAIGKDEKAAGTVVNINWNEMEKPSSPDEPDALEERIKALEDRASGRVPKMVIDAEGEALENRTPSGSSIRPDILSGKEERIRLPKPGEGRE
jgi:hypothetical protein